MGWLNQVDAKKRAATRVKQGQTQTHSMRYAELVKSLGESKSERYNTMDAMSRDLREICQGLQSWADEVQIEPLLTMARPEPGRL